MLTAVKAKQVAAVPYLHTTQLMVSHPRGVRFSTDKPNVVVGPNGGGKSTLLDTLAIRFLASQTGVSTLDDEYLDERYWTKVRENWEDHWCFLDGFDVTTDEGPVSFYRPHHVPGNERDVAHAMCMGYFNEAKAYGELTRRKSSGQRCQALLARLKAALSGQVPTSYELKWSHGRDALDKAKLRDGYDFHSDQRQKIELLKDNARAAAAGQPVVIMDEPEQSLDARSELELWRDIRDANPSAVQVIVATHSLYPILHPEGFNIIECTKGYVQEARAFAASTGLIASAAV